MNQVPQQIQERAKKIKLIMMDVDGVLTDGRIVYGNYGDELKFFDVQDGFGFILLDRAGIKSVIVTAKKSKVVSRRIKDFKVNLVYQGVAEKGRLFDKLVEKFKITPEEVCCIGDDLIDIPAMKKAGLAVTVPNAAEDVKSQAHYVTARRGGEGAAREVIELIIKAQGKWQVATERYFK